MGMFSYFIADIYLKTSTLVLKQNVEGDFLPSGSGLQLKSGTETDEHCSWVSFEP